MSVLFRAFELLFGRIQPPEFCLTGALQGIPFFKVIIFRDFLQTPRETVGLEPRACLIRAPEGNIYARHTETCYPSVSFATAVCHQESETSSPEQSKKFHAMSKAKWAFPQSTEAVTLKLTLRRIYKKSEEAVHTAPGTISFGAKQTEGMWNSEVSTAARVVLTNDATAPTAGGTRTQRSKTAKRWHLHTRRAVTRMPVVHSCGMHIISSRAHRIPT